MTVLEQLKGFNERNKYFLAILIACGVAAVLVTVSMILYMRDDVSRLDVSRPAYEKVRDSLINGSDSSFSASGPLDAAEVGKFQTLLRKKQASLKDISGFNDSTINDESLHLVPGQPQ